MDSEVVALLNPNAGGGRAPERWDRINGSRPGHFKVFTGPYDDNKAEIEKLLCKGQRKFLAIGGDGTVFDLMNGLFASCLETGVSFQELQFGAVGAGSSNDFHKTTRSRTATVALRTSFEKASFHDVLEISSPEWARPKITTLNLSVGLVADANSYFNSEAPFCSFLKRVHVPTAIGWSALRTMWGFTPKSLLLNGNETSFSNLGIVKSRFFAGDFKYPETVGTNDGKLALFVTPPRSRIGFLRAMARLAKGEFPDEPGFIHENLSACSVRADEPFSLEINGEIFRVRSFEAKVIKAGAQLCPPL